MTTKIDQEGCGYVVVNTCTAGGEAEDGKGTHGQPNHESKKYENFVCLLSNIIRRVIDASATNTSTQHAFSSKYRNKNFLFMYYIKQ